MENAARFFTSQRSLLFYCLNNSSELSLSHADELVLSFFTIFPRNFYITIATYFALHSQVVRFSSHLLRHSLIPIRFSALRRNNDVMRVLRT